MSRHFRIQLLLMAALALSAARPASATWPNQPAVNLMVSASAPEEYPTRVIPDGAGGMILAWHDPRSGNNDIYAQHVLASGIVDPAWPVNGRLLCNALNDQLLPVLVSDGAGGAIVAWGDFRNANDDVYAQHVLATGVVDPAWPANGVLLCNALGAQNYPAIVSDGAGGAIVTWQDTRSDQSDVYAQRVLASGSVDPAWPANGALVSGAASWQSGPQIVTDGAGGAIVCWNDMRSGNFDIYARRVLAAGSMDPAWPANGALVCGATGDQASPSIISDGAGGALLSWYDLRSGNHDIYAHHVWASGVDFTWTPNGVLVCNATGSQLNPVMASDGAGGAIVAWNDTRSGSYDIYAHHLLASARVDPAWTANGTPVGSAAGDQFSPTITSDGVGGAIVAWQDGRNGPYNSDVYAQRVRASGYVDPGWGGNGVPLSTAGSHQSEPQLVSDGAGGAIAAWRDTRATPQRLYAQRVDRFGYLGTPEPEFTGIADVPDDDGGKVKLSWNASYLEAEPYQLVDRYNVFRSVPSEVALAALARGAVAMSADGTDSPLDTGLLLTTENGVTYYWELLGTVNSNFLPGYSYLAATTGDSTGSGDPETAFMVQARYGTTSFHWESRPISGRSVDNLAPAAPAPFVGNYSGGATLLNWGPNSEPDLAGYRLYRGSSPGFVPGPANLISTQEITGFADVGPAGSYYKLSAVDVHGNESGHALLSPTATADVAGTEGTASLAFERPRPDPAVGSTTLRFSLPRAGRVSLGVWDAAGRRVRTLLAGDRQAGSHSLNWDLRDQSGGVAAAGLYFVRLEFEGSSLTRRVVALR